MAIIPLIHILGCSSPRTEILVVIDTDLAVPTALSNIEVVVTGPDEEEKSSQIELARADILPVSVGLVHQGGPLGPFEVLARGNLGTEVILERQAVVSFVSEQTLVLTMHLVESCIGVSCPIGETCTEEGCQSTEIDPEDLLEWDGYFHGIDGGDGDADGDSDCSEGDTDCQDSTLLACVSGAWVDQEQCQLGCNISDLRCNRLQPSNVSAELWNQAASDVSLAGTVEFDTNTCDPAGLGSPPPHAEIADIEGQPNLCVLVMREFVVEEGAVLRATGNNGLVILAMESMVINGTIDVGARLNVPGPAGSTPGGPEENAPDDCGGDAGTSDTFESGGGGGGHAAQGGEGSLIRTVPGGTGGNAKGTAELVPLLGGCGGGGGATEPGDGIGGSGGAGGGALQLVSNTSITIAETGIVNAGGGGGQAGGSDAAGGGGGSGGSILLESQTVVVEGAIAANGGGGGAGNTGGDGSDGIGDDQRTPGGEAPADRAAAGGTGGAGEDPTGENGLSNNFNGGGGGGAAGRIRVNTLTDGFSNTGIISPSAVDAFTQGEVSTF